MRNKASAYGLTRTLLISVIVIVFCVFLFLSATGLLRVAMYMFEDARLWARPSAEAAFQLANGHFSTMNPGGYDVQRAGLLYRETLRLDPHHSLARQQLARTLFVQGDIGGALIQINAQLNAHPDSNASAYYIRALVYGFMGLNVDAANDYRRYIELDPSGWYAYNDLAWILLKIDKTEEALSAVDRGLRVAPENAWLLTTRAATLYELGRYIEARDTATRALVATEKLTPEAWADMYKGNDPRSIAEGMAQFVQVNKNNLKKIEQKIAEMSSSTMN